VNQGAQKLRDLGWSLTRLRGELEKLGLQTTTVSISGWRSGRNVPTAPTRERLAVAPFEIAADSWDTAIDTGPGKPKISPARKAPKAKLPPPAKGQLVNAEALARDYLEKISQWREAAEAEGVTAAVKANYASLERQAITLYAKISGQSEATESQLARSPQWARLRADLLAALEAHPKAARAVLQVLQER
jgi:hypothetical protein